MSVIRSIAETAIASLNNDDTFFEVSMWFKQLILVRSYIYVLVFTHSIGYGQSYR